MTRRKKSVPPEERDISHPQNDPNLPPQQRERREEDEGERLEIEGQAALENCLILPPPDLKQLEDGMIIIIETYWILGQSIRVLTQESRNDPKINEIVHELLYWVNNEVADERIVVKSIQEDFYDGQVVQKLIEKLADIKIEVPEVSQSEEGQKQKWRVILDALNRNSQSRDSGKWSAELIHQKV